VRRLWLPYLACMVAIICPASACNHSVSSRADESLVDLSDLSASNADRNGFLRSLTDDQRTRLRQLETQNRQLHTRQQIGCTDPGGFCRKELEIAIGLALDKSPEKAAEYLEEVRPKRFGNRLLPYGFFFIYKASEMLKGFPAELVVINSSAFAQRPQYTGAGLSAKGLVE